MAVAVAFSFYQAQYVPHKGPPSYAQSPEDKALLVAFNGSPADRPANAPPIPAAPPANPVPAPPPNAQHVLSCGTPTQCMTTAGIQAFEQADANFVITNESGWRWWIYNTGGSGAYGLGQALPGCKMMVLGPVKTEGPVGHESCIPLGGTPNPGWETDPIAQLKWCDWYAHGRYGSWAAARAFWIRTDPRPYPNHWW